MTGKDRKLIKRRLQNAMTQSAREFRRLFDQGDIKAATLARERWRILFRAEQDVDTFDFEGVTS